MWSTGPFSMPWTFLRTPRRPLMKKLISVGVSSFWIFAACAAICLRRPSSASESNWATSLS